MTTIWLKIIAKVLLLIATILVSDLSRQEKDGIILEISKLQKDIDEGI